MKKVVIVLFMLCGICFAEDKRVEFTIPKTETILVLHENGDIVWRGRKVGTDKELVDAMWDVCMSTPCPDCGKKRKITPPAAEKGVK